MVKFAILTDSAGDIEKDLRDKYDIDYCSMNVSWNGEEHLASLDWDQGFSAHEFYQLMREGTRVFTTQVPALEFEKKFREHLDKGEDVCYIGCSNALSGSFNTSQSIAAKLAPLYPGRKIVCIDTLISGFAQGAMAITASEMRKEGKTIGEVSSYIESIKLKYNQFGTTEDLSFLKRAGRVSASSAFFGNLFAVKPIVISDAKGHNFAYKKVKGRRASLIEIAQSSVEASEKPENQIIWISHADDLESANFVKSEILKRANYKGVHIGYVGPIIGASTGPGTVIVYCFGKEVTLVGE